MITVNETGFSLSSRSLRNLQGVDPRLVAIVARAIEITPHDFAVIEGLRDLARQRRLFNRGATKTMASRHLTGHAVDLAPWDAVDGIEWDWPSFFPVADAMIAASCELGHALRWGGAWHIHDYRNAHAVSAMDAQDEYIEVRRSEGIRPFLDGPHFELPLNPLATERLT